MNSIDVARGTEATSSKGLDYDDDLEQEQSRDCERNYQHTALDGKFYRFHGFLVLDRDGEKVGRLDWIWPGNKSSEGEFIGVQLQWLGGRARVVPARWIQLNAQTSTLQVSAKKDQIKRAPRYSIDRPLTAEQKRAVCAHYQGAPAVVRNFTGSRSLTS